MPTAALHHMIVPVTDRDAAVDWSVDLLELREPWTDGFFRSVQLDDTIVLDFEVNPDGTGRRLYPRGPDGHLLEVLTGRYTDVPAVSAAG